MTTWLHAGAVAATLAGLLSAASAYAAIRRVRVALGVFLDFLTAAGLLRLADEPSWGSIAAAAAVIAIRKVIAGGFGRSALRGPVPPPRPAPRP
ncbi:hypothetical protein [Streptomyces sp. NPDC047928]|uniref:hypothetical protein n=1 Tax=unclassified Streptomyces TaxID=2593676 RepID=UPI00371EDDC2